jgi:uncharacterized protein YndB with AHSA1/START domain
MTTNARPGARILGSLRSADGKGVVRMEDRFDTDIDAIWSALTDPLRLVRWMGEVEGDLRLGGEFRFRFFASGSEGTGRVDACEPPRQLLLTIEPGQPDEDVIEVTLVADGDRTSLVWEERACPWTSSPLTGPGSRSMSKISPPMSPGVSAATRRRGGTSSSLPIETWRPTSARQGRLSACGAIPSTPHSPRTGG